MICRTTLARAARMRSTHIRPSVFTRTYAQGPEPTRFKFAVDGGFVHLTVPEKHVPFTIRGTPMGKQKSIRLQNIWLRDNCRCASCVNPDTAQRNFDTFELDFGVRVENASMTEDALKVKWTDGHESLHPWDWINAAIYITPEYAGMRWDQFRYFHGKNNIEAQYPKVPYEDCILPEGGSSASEWRPRQGMKKLMDNIRYYGFCFVTDTPKTPEATEALLEQIGPIRNTHYGGFYDFVPDLASKDTAYTNLALEPHTDTTYFTDPAGLQAFHLLSHEAPPNAEDNGGKLGGESILVDGLKIAENMRENQPGTFESLCVTPVAWHASGNKHASITPDRKYPVIETKGGDLQAPVHRIRWNNDDRGVVPMEHATRWYAAARKWAAAVKSPLNQYKFQLEPGKLLIFDNWRMLHGRTEFEGRRRMCGAYINRDDYMSRWKLTQFDSDPSHVTIYNLFQKHLEHSNPRQVHKEHVPKWHKKKGLQSATDREDSQIGGGSWGDMFSERRLMR